MITKRTANNRRPLHTAEYFGLKKRGAVAPGYRADLTVLNNLRDFQVLRVYKDGKLAAENGKVIFEKTAETTEWDAEIKKRVFHSFHCRPIQLSDLALTKKKNQIRVIDLVSHELITKERIENWTELPGMAAGVNPEKDVVVQPVMIPDSMLRTSGATVQKPMMREK